MSQSDMISDQVWMSRCFDLASRGIGFVSPNPPVGAVLVYQNKILAEGYHSCFGGPHAEVEAIRNVADENRHLIPLSTLYVSLEPCCTIGKTPACTDLILREGIKDVRISTSDPNPLVSGKGLTILQSQGVQITTGILEHDGKSLIRPFTTNILRQRPHILLKWAQSKHGFTGLVGQQVWLSDEYSRVWSHKQRAEVDAILAGARTIEADNPSLTTRSYPGRSPQRVVYDPNGRLTGTFNVFKEDGIRVFYFSTAENPAIAGPHILKDLLDANEDPILQMLRILHLNQIGTLLIEGGSYMHRLFIERNLWDEAWVIQTQNPLDHGIAAPNVRGKWLDEMEAGSDRIVGILNENR